MTGRWLKSVLFCALVLFVVEACVKVPDLSGVTAIAGGYDTCALLSDGTVRCWGDNGAGQLASAVTGPQTCNGAPCSTTPRTISGL